MYVPFNFPTLAVACTSCIVNTKLISVTQSPNSSWLPRPQQVQDASEEQYGSKHLRIHPQQKSLALRFRYFFFFLHCRTSARHCRSTTGMSEERKQISPKAKANKNQHTTKQRPQNQTRQRSREICKKVKQVKRPRPSQAPHEFSSAK